ncbi:MULTISPECIES: peroxynitrite isomerase [Mycolicibacter]|uniref:Peroxynitrite isomerase n=1 Tax=[Mycobacterium] vasticus TaxID=2875777 RepID=A0ABU5YVG5_9MYCO|nr:MULTISPECIES: FABP family protein [unclassified Mycolicibacter]MEB3064546.1 FABP family protein [Mycolicibacter sp. MYC101]MEB3068881.1 FABP family protein [Mycolicibacter sp. MYC017]
MAPDLHPNLVELAPLLGTWSGRGRGIYPTITSFDYLEEVVFSHVGKPFFVYGQKTRSAADGLPLHAETGYLRVPEPGRIEWVLAHPSGITEIEVGGYTVDGNRIDLQMSAPTIGLTPTAKEVSALSRHYRLDGDELSYTMDMGAVGQPSQNHLTASLRRS